jgi:hypothetical protein
MERTVQSAWVVLFAVVVLFGSAFNSPCEAGANGKLIEAAKSEGTVSYYTTMTLSQSKKVADRFHAKYPFLDVNLFRGGKVRQSSAHSKR